VYYEFGKGYAGIGLYHRVFFRVAMPFAAPKQRPGGQHFGWQ